MIRAELRVSEEGSEGFLRLFGLRRRLFRFFMRGRAGSGCELEVGAGVLSVSVSDPRAPLLAAFGGEVFVVVDAVLTGVNVASASRTKAVFLLNLQ